MSLRIDLVAERLPELLSDVVESREGVSAAVDAAQEALERWAFDPGDAATIIQEAALGTSRPFALHHDDEPTVTAVKDAPDATEGTVIAVDGSHIEPDRFAAVACSVVNIGYVVFPSGVPGDPELASSPSIQIARGELDFDEGSSPFGRALSLQREARELEQGISLAQRRIGHGPVVLLLDGSLLPWDLRPAGMPATEVKRLVDGMNRSFGIAAMLPDTFSMAAYISNSAASDVVTSLRSLSSETARWPRLDAQLFRRILSDDGQRSALFLAMSNRPDRAETQFPGHEVCFFYLRAGEDIARVELPRWAATEDRVERLHATLVEQARLCWGYPRALQEAHEQAVLSMRDREQFERMLERQAGVAGLGPRLVGKALSKRRRAL